MKVVLTYVLPIKTHGFHKEVLKKAMSAAGLRESSRSVWWLSLDKYSAVECFVETEILNSLTGNIRIRANNTNAILKDAEYLADVNARMEKLNKDVQDEINRMARLRETIDIIYPKIDSAPFRATDNDSDMVK